MYFLNIFKELKYFIFENYYRRTEFTCNKINKKYPILIMPKNTVNLFRRAKIQNWLIDQKYLCNNQTL